MELDVAEGLVESVVETEAARDQTTHGIELVEAFVFVVSGLTRLRLTVELVPKDAGALP